MSSSPDLDISISFPNGETMDLKYIPAGTFWMGSPAAERGRQDSEDLHEVTLTEGYYMGVTEVTQAQWEAVMGTPADLTCRGGVPHGFGPDYPVYCVNWHNVANTGGFVEQLNAHLADTGQPGAGLYGLPTEAMWEKAARAGNQDRFSHGDALECVDEECAFCATHDDFMWWCGNGNLQSEPVGLKEANAFGLYDMHGNVFEWVRDRYSDHLGFDPQTDPTGPPEGSLRVLRGGDWNNNAEACRSANRLGVAPGGRRGALGFRIARTAE